MLVRIFIGLLTICSIVWIAGASYIQNQQTKQFQLEEIFGPQDKTIIAVNQCNFIELIKENESGKINWAIFSKDAFTVISKIYYSTNREHALIQTNDIVTEQTIKDLFQTKVLIDKNNFETDKYVGHYNHTNIYLYEKKIKPNETKWTLPPLDKNATANIIHFEPNTISIIDFYNRKIGQFDFKSTKTRQVATTPINDKELFMHVVSNQITDYSFYKKENIVEFDLSLAQQSWMDLCESGLVITQINKQKGIYFDSKPNTLIQQLGVTNTSTTEQIIAFESNVASKLFNNRKTLYIANLDDHYVVSASKTFCEEALAHYKLGTVLQTNPSKMNHIFSNLPRKVNVRIITSEKQEAIRYVKGQVLSFTRKKNQSPDINVKSDKEENASPKHFNTGGEVKTAFTDNSGRIVIINTDNSIHYFGLNGKILSLNNNTELVQPIRFIYGLSGEQFLPIIQRNKATLYTTSGTKSFEIEPKGNYYFSSLPQFLKVKGKEYLLIGASDGILYWYNARNGKVERQTRISTNNPIDKVSCWPSAGKSTIGVKVNQTFFILNGETNKQIRNFTLPNSIGSTEINGDLKNIVFDKNRVRIINQKGGSVNLSTLDGMTQVQALDQTQSSYIAFDGKNRFVAFTANGEIVVDRIIKDITVDQFDATLGPNNSIILSCLDEINNNIKIINLTTEQILNSEDLKGSRKVLIQAQGKNVFLYTFIDNILIRYDQ